MIADMKKLITTIAAVLISLSLMGQEGGAAPGADKTFRIGADASADFFLGPGRLPPVSIGLGVRARYGRPDQWFNVIGGLRYIYGTRLSGIMIPVLLNVNLIRTDAFSAYLGGGYEFDFIGTYWGAAKYQAGFLVGPHADIQISYKPYQGALGLGFTYYF